MGSRTYRESASIRGSVKVLTAGAGTPRLGRPQAQAARIAVGREVRRVYGDIGELLVYDAFEEVRIGRPVAPRVYSAGVEVSRSLPVGREVAQKPWLQQRAMAAMLAPPPGHVVRTADFDLHYARLVTYQYIFQVSTPYV